uniref:G-protein coupled receptors family 1 profile domain-containing protein n=1 Tax=Oryzias latipes TaxID=8090 RepID=A0A3P9JR91_ORYLA
VAVFSQLNLTAVTSNISSSSELLPSPLVDSRGVLPAVILCLCFLLGVPGNISVIILKPNFQQLSSMTQSLMLNLAVSDLLCLLIIPLGICNLLYSWIFGLLACKIIAYIESCSLYGSMLTIVLLSFQRYMLVVHQQFYNQTKIRLSLVLFWLVIMILSIPVLVVYQLTADQEWVRCRQQFSSRSQKLPILLTEILAGFASIFIVAFSYIQLYRKVNQAAFFNNPQTSRLVTSIIIVFIVLWIPHQTINVLRVGTTALHNDRLEKYFAELSIICLLGIMEQSVLTTASSNISTTSQLFPSPSMDSRGVLPAVILSLCFLLGLPGNIAVIILKPNFQQLSTVLLIEILEAEASSFFFNNPQITTLVISITVTFFVLYFPYHINNILTVIAFFLNDEYLMDICFYWWYISIAIFSLNSSVNPYLYALTSLVFNKKWTKSFHLNKQNKVHEESWQPLQFPSGISQSPLLITVDGLT